LRKYRLLFIYFETFNSSQFILNFSFIYICEIAAGIGAILMKWTIFIFYEDSHIRDSCVVVSNLYQNKIFIFSIIEYGNLYRAISWLIFKRFHFLLEDISKYRLSILLILVVIMNTWMLQHELRHLLLINTVLKRFLFIFWDIISIEKLLFLKLLLLI
jgi:hypothetical protein